MPEENPEPAGNAGHFSVSIGGDAHGVVVAGHGNQVETAAPAPEPASQPAPAPESAPDSVAVPGQTNTASGESRLYTVMNGTMHIHHEAGAEAGAEAEEPL